MSSSAKKKIKYKKKPRKDIFMKNILTRKIILPFQSVGSNIKENIIKILEEESYNKCSKEGYIKNNSINILSYSSGIVEENHVVFDVSFECDICHPVEGQLIKCQVQNITRAGIKAVYVKKKNHLLLCLLQETIIIVTRVLINLKKMIILQLKL